MRLKTALDHLTVIELGEPVMQVASGSASFKVEWRENKVFIQPIEADARTNLFIWTATQRLNYELEPAGAVGDMDFAIDQVLARPHGDTKLQATPTSISDLLLEAQPVRLQSKQRTSKPVEIWINDLYQKDGHLLVRYTVCNRGKDAYSIAPPRVFQLDGVRSAQSLYGLANSQLSDEQGNKLKIKRRVAVKVVGQELESNSIAPGSSASGIVSLEMAPSSEPAVLSFQFLGRNNARDQRTLAITAYLVR
jgi:hypothetical protein